MYIQITTQCNMSCAHCCYACTEKGEDMTLETYRKALEWDTETVAIGGGEPTLHPLFWQMLGEAIGAVEYPWMATNGSQTDIALALAKMARKGVIGCALSIDGYHDPIDPAVVKAFTPAKAEGVYYGRSNEDCRELRDVSKDLADAGRCDFGTSDSCVCENMFVEPDGTVKWCGCEDSPILGNINSPDFEFPEDYNYECHKNREAVA